LSCWTLWHLEALLLYQAGFGPGRTPSSRRIGTACLRLWRRSTRRWARFGKGEQVEAATLCAPPRHRRVTVTRRALAPPAHHAAAVGATLNAPSPSARPQLPSVTFTLIFTHSEPNMASCKHRIGGAVRTLRCYAAVRLPPLYWGCGTIPRRPSPCSADSGSR
jgi:hypothetical protein